MLLFTVDLPVFPKRVFNTRNGFGFLTGQPRRNLPSEPAQMLTLPDWWPKSISGRETRCPVPLPTITMTGSWVVSAT